MLAAGGSVGALLAAPTSDYLGRKWSVFGWGLVFVVGAAMQMVADYKVLLGGRFIAGMGVGASSMLTPQFLAENSPKSVRGSMTATYNLMIVFCLMLAFFINYGVSKWSFPGVEYDNSQWRTAMGIQLIPGALMCMMVPFVPETPRWLINHGKQEKGLANICKLRKLPADHEYVQTEYREIEAQVRHEQECFAGHNYWVVLKDIFTSRNNFQRFFLAAMLFLFHKFTGTDSLNVSSPFISRSGETSSLTIVTVLCTRNFCHDWRQWKLGYLIRYWHIRRCENSHLPFLRGISGRSCRTSGPSTCRCNNARYCHAIPGTLPSLRWSDRGLLCRRNTSGRNCRTCFHLHLRLWMVIWSLCGLLRGRCRDFPYENCKSD